MLLRKWDELPEFMKNNEVKEYYNILNKKRFSLILKRFFDIIASLILLIILSPVFLTVSIWIKLDSKGPVFYRQERITQYGKVFRIFKFRTMVINADEIGSLITTQNDSRITKVGEKIRKSRIDEIPQILNILFGEMSFVGTRPEVKKYVGKYTNEMLATLLLPAGVTSLASIYFKDEDIIISKCITIDNSVDDVYIRKVLPEKMKYNLKYIKELGIGKDLMLCIKTIL